MMRSLYSGVAGLRNHQTRMDVIGNNIANVNTVGFKSSRVIFQDLYSQTVKPASGPQTVPTPIGGTNGMQIGLGMNVQAIDIMFNSAAAQYTGGNFDLCIQGDGFFIVNTGYKDATAGNGGINYYTRAGNFYVDKAGNLLAANGYSVMGLQNTTAGNVDAAGNPVETLTTTSVPLKIPAGFVNVAITDKGEIVGTKGDVVHVIGKIELATFANNQGLEKCGQNLYRKTVNSGDPDVKLPGVNGHGLLNPGSLEMSNVDLAGEFTDMIVTQRGFQANSRIITVSDTMLEELVNLKR